MKNLVVTFDAQSINLELRSAKFLPNDKAEAVLEKMREEEKRYNDEAIQMF